jgi:hypothetical protein
MKLDDQRAAAFQHRTPPYAHLTVHEYGDRITQWLDAVELEAEPPTKQQNTILQRVSQRILQEFALTHEGEDVPEWLRAHVGTADADEPLQGLIHGLPGTGKSRVIRWIRRLFEEPLSWEHGQDFICVAFQNRMASAIGGTTLHSGANLPRPGDKVAQKLSHSDVDNLFLQNQALRWVLVDEVSMIPDELLGSFESHFRDAARQTRYKHRKDRSPRMFGGYNILFCLGLVAATANS